MKLITEEINKVEFIVEESNGKKSLFIEGNFLQGNIKNRNGRVYRTETLAREVGRYNEQYVQKGRALGELGHPDGPTVNLDLSLIHISEPTRRYAISYAVFCLKKKK